jgi:hypothetical protein
MIVMIIVMIVMGCGRHETLSSLMRLGRRIIPKRGRQQEPTPAPA